MSVLQYNILALLQLSVQYVVKYTHFKKLTVTDILRRTTNQSRDTDWLLCCDIDTH